MKKSSDKRLLNRAIEIIEQSDYRLTQPRRALLEAIVQHKGPFSVPDLEKTFSGKSARGACDLVTIYRTIPVLEQLGIIEKCDFSEDVAQYEVTLDHKGHHHHHIVCTQCKRVEPLEFCIVDGQEQFLKKKGYTELKHRLEFSGLCPSCSK